MLVAWSSPTLPQLLAPDSPIPITDSQGSWIAAAMQGGSIIAVFLMVLTVDAYGRKLGILASAIPVLVHWLLIAQATTPEELYISRFIGGCGTGYGKIVIGTYIGEIAEPAIRGALGTFMGITYILGVLFVYCVGSFVSMATFAYISTAIPILLFVTFMWMPETPYYYLMTGQKQKALDSLEHLRGHTMVDEEFERINSGIKKRIPFLVSLKKLFYERSNREPFIVMCMLFLSIQFSGKIPILAYCHSIFESAGNSHIPAYVSAIITGLVQLVALIYSTMTIDKSGRRPLLIMSCAGCALSLGSLAVYFFIKDKLLIPTDHFDWVPLVSLIVYNFVFNIGLGNVPFIMVGELFPSDVKSVAVCLTSICLPCASVLNIKLYQYLVNVYGNYMSFSLFTLTCVISGLYCYFRVPETKGKSLEEIQTFFEGKNKSRR